jgi:hypothetical protein
MTNVIVVYKRNKYVIQIRSIRTSHKSKMCTKSIYYDCRK